ncbi:HNH endonuclease, partial [Enterococcus faecium]|nr:HNH endonuclease [Enterococcus faecium]
NLSDAKLEEEARKVSNYNKKWLQNMLTKRSFASQKQKYINVIPSYLNMLNDLQKVFVNFAKKKGHL